MPTSSAEKPDKAAATADERAGEAKYQTEEAVAAFKQLQDKDFGMASKTQVAEHWSRALTAEVRARVTMAEEQLATAHAERLALEHAHEEELSCLTEEARAKEKALTEKNAALEEQVTQLRWESSSHVQRLEEAEQQNMDMTTGLQDKCEKLRLAMEDQELQQHEISRLEGELAKSHQAQLATEKELQSSRQTVEALDKAIERTAPSTWERFGRVLKGKPFDSMSSGTMASAILDEVQKGAIKEARRWAQQDLDALTEQLKTSSSKDPNGLPP